MFKQIRIRLFTGFAVISFMSLIIFLSFEKFIAIPPQKIMVTTGYKGGANELFGKRYKEILARSGIELEIVNSLGTGENLQRLKDPNSGFQVGFSQDGGGDDQLTNLVSLGQIGYQPYWIFYRSSQEWTDIDALKGKRVAIGAEGTGRHKLAQSLHLDASTPLDLSKLVGNDATRALKDGRVDAILTSGTLESAHLQELIRDPTIRLMSLPRAEALAKIYPQLVHLVLPAGVVDFEKKIPLKDVELIATTTSVLVRRDLNTQIIYLLAQALEEAHNPAGIFHRAGNFPTQFDTRYPMSEAARDFYKNGPSFLNKYMPILVTSYLARMLATLAAIMAISLPVFRFLKNIYNWCIKHYTDNLFQRLRLLHLELHQPASTISYKSIQDELDSIDLSTHLLPMWHTDVYFSLISRIENERKILEKNAALS